MGYSLMPDAFGSSISPGFNRSIKTTPLELRDRWKDWCSEWMKEFTDQFAMDGRTIEIATLQEWMQRFEKGDYSY